jgi:hypothetical protein
MAEQHNVCHNPDLSPIPTAFESDMDEQRGRWRSTSLRPQEYVLCTVGENSHWMKVIWAFGWLLALDCIECSFMTPRQ